MRFKYYNVMADMQGLAVHGVKRICVICAYTKGYLFMKTYVVMVFFSFQGSIQTNGCQNIHF